jgi:hypothetical protein
MQIAIYNTLLQFSKLLKSPLLGIFAINKNGQIMAILQIAIYKNGQIIAIKKLQFIKTAKLMQFGKLLKFPSIGNLCKFIKTAKLLQFS